MIDVDSTSLHSDVLADREASVPIITITAGNVRMTDRLFLDASWFSANLLPRLKDRRGKLLLPV